MNILSFLFGKTKIKIQKNKTAKLLNITSNLNISYSDLNPGEIYTYIDIPTADKHKLLYELDKKEIEYSIEKEKGLPKIIKQYRKRVGILIGLIIGIGLIIISRSVIWKIEIIGNEQIKTGEIIETLKECGLTLGKKITKINKDNISNRLLLESDNISWASVNIKGTTAIVEIRENENDENDKKTAEKTLQYANIVSKYDGQIDKIEYYLGEAVVKSGDYVRKGDILISGIYKSGNNHEKIIRASGEVYGTIIEQYSITVPYVEEIKEPTKLKLLEKSIIFFDKSLKVYKNSRKVDATCDIINNKYVLSIFDKFDLPISIEKTELQYYTVRQKTLNSDEMINRAYEKIKEKIAFDFDGNSIESVEYMGEFRDDGYYLVCNVKAYSNMGETREIEIKK